MIKIPILGFVIMKFGSTGIKAVAVITQTITIPGAKK
jgi:hypothetical protein